MINSSKTASFLSVTALRGSFAIGGAALVFAGFCGLSATAQAQSYTAAQRPALIITSQPVPESLKNINSIPMSAPRSVITPVPTPVAVRQPASSAPVSIIPPVRRPVQNPVQTVSYAAPPRARVDVSNGVNDVQAINPALYSKPVQVREIKKQDIIGTDYFSESETLVTRKVAQIKQDMKALQVKTTALARRLQSLEKDNENQSAEYYAAVATISTQLQSGTTPGNPRLMKKLAIAEQELEAMSSGIDNFNNIALQASEAASESEFLLEEARAAYGIFGAIEEDHVELAKAEDGINNTVVMVDRVLNTVNDDLGRMAAYINSERHNLRVLSLGVANGDLYGKSFGGQPFNMAQQFSLGGDNRAPDGLVSGDRVRGPSYAQNDVNNAAPAPQALSGPRALAKIRFDRPDVQYEQPVYTAVNEALRRYPNARFDLVAVHPTGGNAAQNAIESTRSRRNAERVLRALTQMGLPNNQIDLSYDEDQNIDVNEVRIYVR